MGVERTRVVGLEVLEMPQEVNQWDGVRRVKDGVVGGFGQGREGLEERCVLGVVESEGSVWGGNGVCGEGMESVGREGCVEGREDVKRQGKI